MKEPRTIERWLRAGGFGLPAMMLAGFAFNWFILMESISDEKKQTGHLKKDREEHRDSFVPNHGDLYATALHLSDIDSKGRGRNERPPLTFIKKG